MGEHSARVVDLAALGDLPCIRREAAVYGLTGLVQQLDSYRVCSCRVCAHAAHSPFTGGLHPIGSGVQGLCCSPRRGTSYPASGSTSTSYSLLLGVRGAVLPPGPPLSARSQPPAACPAQLLQRPAEPSLGGRCGCCSAWGTRNRVSLPLPPLFFPFFLLLWWGFILLAMR